MMQPNYLIRTVGVIFLALCAFNSTTAERGTSHQVQQLLNNAIELMQTQGDWAR
ncbi:MAG: hypothetical protein V7629_20115 [Motiliproteus sp.]